MGRKVRYWQGEAIHARFVAENVLSQLEACTGRPAEPTDWPGPDWAYEKEVAEGREIYAALAVYRRIKPVHPSAAPDRERRFGDEGATSRSG
jgi:hypothetical protein